LYKGLKDFKNWRKFSTRIKIKFRKPRFKNSASFRENEKGNIVNKNNLLYRIIQMTLKSLETGQITSGN